MSALTETPVLLLSTACLSALLSLALVKLDKHLMLTAAPREDRWHRRPTPNSGGIALILSCAVVYLLRFQGVHTPVALGAIAICVLGFADDRLRLSPVVKLASQCAIALFVVLNGVVFPGTPWSLLNAAFSFLWIVGITNAFNLIDNMDGLCAGVTVIICVFRFWLLAAHGHQVDASLCAVIAGAFLGFLILNYNPARIFMGDCGSMFAGFSLASLAIASPLAHTKVFLAGVFYPALTFTYPIFDALLVSVLRKAAGRSISVGGRDHSSHRLTALNLSERKVVWILWLLTALGSAAGLMIHWMPLVVIVAVFFLVAALTMFAMFLGSLPPYQVSLRKHVRSLRAGIILIVDSLTAGLALFAGFLIRYETDVPPLQIHNLLVSLPVVAICHGAVSFLEKTFYVPWRSFGASDMFVFARAVVTGAAFSSFVLWFMSVKYYPRGVIVLYCILNLGFSVALRIFLRALQDLPSRQGGQRSRVAILGANQHGEAAASLLRKYAILRANPVLYLDNEPARIGLRIGGIPIRSGENKLAETARQFALDAVVMPVVTADNSVEAEQYRELKLQCVRAGLPVRGLNVSMHDLSPVDEQPA